VWIAAEAGVARRLREHLVETRGLDKRWIKAAGYWVAGEADSSAKNLGEDRAPMASPQLREAGSPMPRP
jgi:hypothetical protein